MVGALIVLSLPLACANRGQSQSQLKAAGDASTAVVKADWNDVAASLYAAMREQGVTILSEKHEPLEQRFELLTIRDERGLLTATRGSQERDPVLIELRCTIGHVRNPALEKRVLDRVVRRLGDLMGVDARPIR